MHFYCRKFLPEDLDSDLPSRLKYAHFNISHEEAFMPLYMNQIEVWIHFEQQLCCVVWYLQYSNSQILNNYFEKHCQRHNGPEGWVLLTKLTAFGHITSSYTNLDQTLQNLDQAPTSKSQPNISISTKLKLINLDQTKLQNLDQDWTS